MRRLSRILFGTGAIGLAGFAVLYWLVLPQLGAPGTALDLSGLKGDATRGAYVATAAGCLACHTDNKNGGKPFAGGPALKTPFGTFHAPNITPHPTSGIGGWSLKVFARALTQGISPAGKHYYPSFPYTSYAGMHRGDIADLKAYLDTVSPVATVNRPHDLFWPINNRRFLGGWKSVYFNRAPALRVPPQTPAPATPPVRSDSPLARGAYLVNVLGHCGECHTQRGLLGGKSNDALAGNTRGPEGKRVPSIAGMGMRKISPWSRDDIAMSLQLGMTPTGDFLGGDMAKVITHSTSKLTLDDVTAISEYLLSLR